MTSVRVRENEPFEAALRRFKRTIEKDRPPDRAPRPRVLRKADRPSASARRPPRSSATTSASAASSCRPSSTDRRRHRKIIEGAKRFAPFALWTHPTTMTPQGPDHRGHEDRDAREGHGASVGDPAACWPRSSSARSTSASSCRRRRPRGHRQDGQAAARTRSTSSRPATARTWPTPSALKSAVLQAYMPEPAVRRRNRGRDRGRHRARPVRTGPRRWARSWPSSRPNWPGAPTWPPYRLKSKRNWRA